MNKPPRHPREDRMVNGTVLAYSYGYVGIMQSMACWFVFFCGVPKMASLFHSETPPMQYSEADVLANQEGMASYYWTLVLAQVGAAIACTTTRQSVLSYGVFRNPCLNLCIILEVSLALIIMYVAPLAGVFKLAPLSGLQLVLGFSGFFLV